MRQRSASGVLNDRRLKESAQDLIDTTTPMLKLLRDVDSGQAFMGKIYWRMYDVQGEIEKMKVDERTIGIWREQWEKMHVPVVTVAYALDQEFIDHDHYLLPDLNEEWDVVGDILGSRGAAEEAKIAWQVQADGGGARLPGAELAWRRRRKASFRKHSLEAVPVEHPSRSHQHRDQGAVHAGCWVPMRTHLVCVCSSTSSAPSAAAASEATTSGFKFTCQRTASSFARSVTASGSRQRPRGWRMTRRRLSTNGTTIYTIIRSNEA